MTTPTFGTTTPTSTPTLPRLWDILGRTLQSVHYFRLDINSLLKELCLLIKNIAQCINDYAQFSVTGTFYVWPFICCNWWHRMQPCVPITEGKHCSLTWLSSLEQICLVVLSCLAINFLRGFCVCCLVVATQQKASYGILRILLGLGPDNFQHGKTTVQQKW